MGVLSKTREHPCFEFVFISSGGSPISIFALFILLANKGDSETKYQR